MSDQNIETVINEDPKVKYPDLFRLYLMQNRNNDERNIRMIVREELLKDHFGSLAVKESDQRRFIGSREYTDRFTKKKQDVQRSIKKKYSYDRAINDPEILSGYTKIEDLADKVRRSGQDVVFDDLDRQAELIGYYELDPGSYIADHAGELEKDIISVLSDHLKNDHLFMPDPFWDEDLDDFDFYDDDEEDDFEDVRLEDPDRLTEIDEDNFDEYVYLILEDGIMHYMENNKDDDVISDEIIAQKLLSYDPEFEKKIEDGDFLQQFIQSMWMNEDVKKICAGIDAYFTKERIRDLVAANDLYGDMISNIRMREEKERLEKERRTEEKKRKKERQKAISENIVRTMPDRIQDLFPAARMMHRKFVLHIGPTNSGKTYQAIERLKQAESGIYLAPLRLLAYEQYETLNKDGYPCDMITGEEKIEVPGSRYTSSTIEMLPMDQRYDIAVIDEAQMISDPDRGGAWLSAILGVLADEIHVCMAPEAEKIIISLIESCGDEYVIERHDRKAGLIMQHDPFVFPKDVQKGDALIVFSRKNVHVVAAELQRKKWKCSILYGNLPYDVRRKEADIFMNGETDVVVSTDCIGMGMNLPVRRVVFLEQNKFDGKKMRDLTNAEIKQIGGRAGRYGIYDQGYVASSFGKRIQNGMNRDVKPIDHVFVSFPQSLIGIDGPLSEIIAQWGNVSLPEMFRKESVESLHDLSAYLEKSCTDKKLIYELASIPFNVKDETLMRIWRDLSSIIIHGKEPRIGEYIPVICKDQKWSADDMAFLEERSQICDLLYNFCRKFSFQEYEDQIRIARETVSEVLISLLSKSMLSGKKCKQCGKMLPWNHPYGICERCYQRSYDFWW